MKEQDSSDKKIVVIGGGTGSFHILTGLKYHSEKLSSLVNMVDDGGSTGRLRKDLDVLPPGDVRQCLIALSNAPEELGQLFNYRFENGDLKGHPLGNLFLSAAEKMTGNFNDAVKLASDILKITGEVIPITLNKTCLLVNHDGKISKGQSYIDSISIQGENRPILSIDPEAEVNPEAISSIMEAELIVIAPGDLYTSIGPLLIVKGVGEALTTTNAKVIYVCNIMSKKGHTGGLSVSGHADEIERISGGHFLDYVLYNTDVPPKYLLSKYAKEGEDMVQVDGREIEKAKYEAVGRPLIDPEEVVAVKGDYLADQRSYIRHNSEKVARELLDLL